MTDQQSRPVILDLFCGAGGAAKGYAYAGFEVFGVDIEPQPNYPYRMWKGDAIYALDWLLDGNWNRMKFRDQKGDGIFLNLDDFDAIHASPPCQDYSVTASLHDRQYPRLIQPIRQRLERAGVPYVIENVQGARADLRNPVLLCGSSFDLGVRRHRLFELSWPVTMVPPCAHYLQPEPVDVTGTGGMRKGERTAPGGGNSRKPNTLAHAREVMGINWMSRRELSEAIPPAYTRWIGEQLRTVIEQGAAA